MQQMLDMILSQSPIAAAMLFVGLWFLRWQRQTLDDERKDRAALNQQCRDERREDQERFTAERRDAAVHHARAMEALIERYNGAQDRSTVVMRDVSSALDRNASAVADLQKEVRAMRIRSNGSAVEAGG